MTTNPILEGLHATRRKLLADAGGTLEGLVAELQKRQQASGRRIIDAKRERKSARVANSDDAAMDHQSSPVGDR